MKVKYLLAHAAVLVIFTSGCVKSSDSVTTTSCTTLDGRPVACDSPSPVDEPVLNPGTPLNVVKLEFRKVVSVETVDDDSYTVVVRWIANRAITKGNLLENTYLAVPFDFKAVSAVGDFNVAARSYSWGLNGIGNGSEQNTLVAVEEKGGVAYVAADNGFINTFATTKLKFENSDRAFIVHFKIKLEDAEKILPPYLDLHLSSVAGEVVLPINNGITDDSGLINNWLSDENWDKSLQDKLPSKLSGEARLDLQFSDSKVIKLNIERIEDQKCKVHFEVKDLYSTKPSDDVVLCQFWNQYLVVEKYGILGTNPVYKGLDKNGNLIGPQIFYFKLRKNLIEGQTISGDRTVELNPL